MGFFGHAACAIGIHKWLPWAYKEPTKCMQIEKCARCGKIPDETRVVHIFGDWSYVTEADCSMQRVCSRCANVESRTQHVWPGWSYVREHSCDLQRICGRCGATETSHAHAGWTDWEYKTLGSCVLTRGCTRCAEKEKTEEHSMGGWTYEAPKSCTQIRFCERCHKKDIKFTTGEEDHEEWGDWQYRNKQGYTSFERYCLRCGKWDFRSGDPIHVWGDWQPTSPGRGKRSCQRCRELEVGSMPR